MPWWISLSFSYLSSALDSSIPFLSTLWMFLLLSLCVLFFTETSEFNVMAPQNSFLYLFLWVVYEILRLWRNREPVPSKFTCLSFSSSSPVPSERNPQTGRCRWYTPNLHWWFEYLLVLLSPQKPKAFLLSTNGLWDLGGRCMQFFYFSTPKDHASCLIRYKRGLLKHLWVLW
jgi:hypothetical protein